MIRAFNASTSVHPFSLPQPSPNKIAVITPAEILQSTSPPLSSVAQQTPEISHLEMSRITPDSLQKKPAQTPDSPQRIPAQSTEVSSQISQAMSTASPGSSQVTSKFSSVPTTTDAAPNTSGVTQNGLNLATSIPPFSAIGAPTTNTLPATSTASAPTAASSNGGPPQLTQPGLISISVVGGVVALVAISLLFYALRRRRQQLLNSLPLGSAPCSPRNGSFARVQAEASTSLMRSRVPSPLPMAYSPYHDEKEVFTPGPAIMIPNDGRSHSVASFRRPTHPLFLPDLESPLTPLTPTANPPSASSMHRSRSWQADAPLSAQSPGIANALLPKALQLSPTISYPNIRTQGLAQNQYQLVSPMWPLSPPGPGIRSSPISPLVGHASLIGRTELPSPVPNNTSFPFNEIRWQQTHSATTSAAPSRRPSQTTQANEPAPDEEIGIATSPSIYAAQSIFDTYAPTERALSAEYETPASPVELSATGKSRPGTASTIALAAARAGIGGTGMTPVRRSTRSGPVMKRSETAKSGASSRYSGGGVLRGDRVIPKMPSIVTVPAAMSGDAALPEEEDDGEDQKGARSGDADAALDGRKSAAATVTSGRSKRGSWESETFSTLSIQSVLDLVRSESQKQGRGGGIDG